MACGRLPVSGTDLMSQPTLSRLENAPCWRQLARMGIEQEDEDEEDEDEDEDEEDEEPPVVREPDEE